MYCRLPTALSSNVSANAVSWTLLYVSVPRALPRSRAAVSRRSWFRTLLAAVLAGEAPEVSGDHPLHENLRRLNDASLQRRRTHAKKRGIDLLK